MSQALLNGISFYNGPLDIQGITNLLFSTFLVTQLFSAINQAIIPHLIDRRTLFEARERDSRIYSWVIYITANILAELFWQTLISVPVFATWYYPTGMQHNGDGDIGPAERGALTFMFVWFFNLWASTLSLLFASSIEHVEVATQIATLFYWLALLFCGYVFAIPSL
jgi:ATP-binding cassette, subfamily G (WHITE), member 2, PDR